jgi:hypothetical protein
MSPIDPLKLAAALAAEVNARQATDYEAKPSQGGAVAARFVSKKGEARPAGLLLRPASLDAAASAAASALAARLDAALKGKAGVLSLMTKQAPGEKEVEAWAAAAAQAVEGLESSAGKEGGDFLVLEEPPAGAPFGYASWAPGGKGGLTVDVLFRAGVSAEPAKSAEAEDHWLVLTGEPAASGGAVGRAFGLSLPEGAKIRRAWWAAPAGDGFGFRRI